MDRIRRSDLELLLAPQTGPCVSLFMPMHVKDKNAQDDPTCLRDLCDQAEQTLVDRGMKPADALRAATVNAADLLGVTDRGRIAGGLRADLIAVAGNPLEDVRVLEDPRFVMKAGQIYKRP